MPIFKSFRIILLGYVGNYEKKPVRFSTF